MKRFTSTNVFEAALQRIIDVYKEGHRVIVSFSAGKDSTAVMEMTIEAARRTGNLPVEVWMRDEEIMYPGTYEYAERVASRKEVKFEWLISGQASVNIFNRANPYYWVFDDRLDQSQWMRTPPPYAKWVEQKSLYNIINPTRYPPPDGKFLYVTMGVRGSESRRRNMIIHQNGGAVSKATPARKTDDREVRNRDLERHFRPIYDWTTQDVWLAIKEHGWDYNTAYDTMTRFGVKREAQRIAPVTMTEHGIPLVQMASRAWPEWFERLSVRLPGVKLGALYGKQALLPVRRPNETWQDAYQRICIDGAPAWISERSIRYRDYMNRQHSNHSTEPFHEVAACPTCSPAGGGSWRKMTMNMYSGDPFLLNTDCRALGYLEPEDMRPGAGKFDGKPGA